MAVVIAKAAANPAATAHNLDLLIVILRSLGFKLFIVDLLL
ncbi:hypothetical protein NTGM5_620007 [Candidatus Nitrotoga sp. M5]|nr:hypothetical protein NTGM5_620007 [Candidatus Nitrotoga sp. M5]